jgi:hypothetical protein
MNQKEKDFEELYLAYYRYIYKYEVGYENDFEPDKPNYRRSDFKQNLQDEGMAIKIRMGY